MSSTSRELRAVYGAFADKHWRHTVKWFTDNQNVVCIVQEKLLILSTDMPLALTLSYRALTVKFGALDLKLLMLLR